MTENKNPNDETGIWPGWFFPRTRSFFERRRKNGEYKDVNFPNEPPTAADEIALLARLRALQESVKRFSAWDRCEVRELIEGARDAVVVAHNTKVGLDLLRRAQDTYYLGLQTRNRLSYAFWSVVGTVFAFVIFMALRWLLTKWSPEGGQVHLPEWDTTLKVVGLAALGSLVSAATRVISIDLRYERNRSIIFAMVAAKAIVAIGFAIVVYIILSSGVAKFEGIDSGRHGVWFLAAFLSGFSERFASNLISKIPGTQGIGKP